VRDAIRTANSAAPAPADRDLLLGAVYADASTTDDRVAREGVEVLA
jgi:hypothetical protein